MAIAQTPTNLAHLKEHEVEAAVFSQHCINWSVYVLSIRACIDVSVPSASVEVDILGSSIGKCVLDPAHPICTIGGSIAGFKAEVTLDIKGDCLAVQAEVCAPIVGCKKWAHNLFCW